MPFVSFVLSVLVVSSSVLLISSIVLHSTVIHGISHAKWLIGILLPSASPFSDLCGDLFLFWLVYLSHDESPFMVCLFELFSFLKIYGRFYGLEFSCPFSAQIVWG